MAENTSFHHYVITLIRLNPILMSSKTYFTRLKRDRKKFTTMMHPVLTNQLKKTAIDKEMSAADIIEELVINFLEQEKNKKSLSVDRL